MNVHKICTHAALSLALVSSATSHGMDYMPSTKAAFIGGAVVASVVVVGAAGYGIKKYYSNFPNALKHQKTILKNVNNETTYTQKEITVLKRKAASYDALQSAYDPVLSEKDSLLLHKNDIENWFRSFLALAPRLRAAIDDDIVQTGGAQRGSQKFDGIAAVNKIMNHNQETRQKLAGYDALVEISGAEGEELIPVTVPGGAGKWDGILLAPVIRALFPAAGQYNEAAKMRNSKIHRTPKLN